ncbi:phage terminase large subunit [Azospirillum sp. A1-3]|uniref:phage terminase large subunit n=1 Tax=Azospirillum sp. A1-3 TaxID=185874 RepID=UPI0020776C5D|nr:phage terminase large subunit [Azospirillum sp. A1-3]MCM8734576.1 phage terminase large subunit [Azospirillum sp. A1-3]
MTGKDDDSFAGFVDGWNEMVELKTPAHHARMAGWLEEHMAGPNRRMLLMAFRGSGKSTLVGLFAAWLLLRDPNRRLLVLAADLKLAMKMVRNVKRILERHPGCSHLKPPSKERDQWAADRFTVVRPTELRDPSMAAAGIGGNITGSRADVVICDDVEVPRNADTAVKRAALRERLSELEYVLVPGGAQLYVGTPHAQDSLYAEETDDGSPPFLDGFERLVLPVYTEDEQGKRTYTWKERFGEAHVARIRKSTGPNKFTSQMLLRPVSVADGVLNVDNLGRYDAELEYREALGRAVLTLDGVKLVSATCWWDPAFARPAGEGDGRVKSGDGSVVAAVFAGEDKRLYLHRVRYLAVDPKAPETEADQQCRQVSRFLADNHLPAVHIEINGIGRFLPGLLRERLRNDRLAAGVVEEFSHTPKVRRILEAFDALLADRRLLAHRQVWETPFIREMRDWRPDGRYRGPDDGLDAVAGCLGAEPYRFDRSTAPSDRRADWRGAGAMMAEADWEL